MNDPSWLHAHFQAPLKNFVPAAPLHSSVGILLNQAGGSELQIFLFSSKTLFDLIQNDKKTETTNARM